MGHGVSTCATCDGSSSGNQSRSAVGTPRRRSDISTRFATHVTVIHRRDSLRASKIMQDKAFANDKIEWDTEVVEVRDPAQGVVSGII
jgi:thioredoxin reductase (NADPH)